MAERGGWCAPAGEVGRSSFALEALDRLGVALRALADVPRGHGLPSVLLAQAVEGLRAQGGVLAARRGGHLQAVAASGELAEVHVAGHLLELSDAVPLADAVRLGEPVWVPSGAGGAVGEGAEAIEGAEQAVAALPLLSHGDAMGVLGLTFAGRREFTRVERQFLGMVADLCAACIDHWWLPSPADEALVVELSPEGPSAPRDETLAAPFTFVGLLTPSGRLTEANRGALEAAAMEMDDVVDRPLWETYWWSWSTEIRDLIRTEISRAAAGEARRFRADMRVAEGRLVRLDLSLVPLVAGGHVHAIVPSGIDVSGRSRHELHLSSLAHLARQLSAALTTDEVARIVVDGSSGVLGSTYSSIALLDVATDVVRVLSPAPRGPGAGDGAAQLPLRAHSLHTDAIRDGSMILLPDPEALWSAYPDVAAERAAAGLSAMAAVPLRHGDGAAFGALVVGWPGAVEVDEELRLGVETVADLCARTLRRTHLSDVRSELVSALQTELLPAVPDVAGLEISVRYLPATNDLGFSGDWYDVVPLSPDRTAIVVGDVAGHGIQAAAQMSHVRGVINTLARLGTSVATIFAQAQKLLTHLGDPFIGTATLFVVDTRRNRLWYAHAGHPPIVVRDPTGRAATLEDARGPALGMPMGELGPMSAPFPPGSVAVAYTDGLVERRNRGLAAGIDLLVSTVAAEGDRDVGIVAEQVVEALTRDHPLGDDVAMVVVRRTTARGEP